MFGRPGPLACSTQTFPFEHVPSQLGYFTQLCEFFELLLAILCTEVDQTGYADCQVFLVKQ